MPSSEVEKKRLLQSIAYNQFLQFKFYFAEKVLYGIVSFDLRDHDNYFMKKCTAYLIFALFTLQSKSKFNPWKITSKSNKKG